MLPALLLALLLTLLLALLLLLLLFLLHDEVADIAALAEEGLHLNWPLELRCVISI
ncbi:hypothetical protein CC86DRAFT_369015 [Ophiobolus disseminans]|uniref:Uncharacterized protein n=1 Tax=Ophiobolus disseminans TaxID=1469910 RepID=A0A6A7A345_9PLEO|nr:hypothetical protein CC86DRAFT_369015 [Ophiobolus disseminans]